MIKKVDVAVFSFISDVKDNKFQAGEKIFDLKAGGVDYATTGGLVDDIKPKLDAYKQQIIDGKIQVPTKP
jgi:basic membrane protein A